MASTQRKRTGPTHPVPGKVQAGVAAEIGDLCVLTAGYVVPASSVATAVLAHATFLGVLVQGATTGDETADTDCLVETVGDFEYPLAAAAVAAVPIGTTVRSYVTGGAASDQIVEAAGTAADALGVLNKAIAVGDTNCLVRIKSTVMEGGVQAPA